MKALQQMLASLVLVVVLGCAALALLGACSNQEAAPQIAQESAPAAASSSYSSAGIELATQEEWTRLQDMIIEAQAYTDPAPYTEEAWGLLEQAKSMANRAMMDYPDTSRSLVRGAAQQLESAMLTLQRK